MRVEKFFKKREVIIIMVIVLAASISLLLAQTVFNFDYAGITDSRFSQNADSILRPDYIEGEVLVKFKPGVDMSSVDHLVDSLFLQVERRFPAISRVKGQAYALVKSNQKTTRQVMTELAGFPEVEEVSPNYRVYADSMVPNDPRFSELWGLHNTGQTGGTADIDIDAPEVWDKTTGSSEVIVAVIDTGIDYNHPDLLANLWVNPYEIKDGVDNDGNGYIDDIHGINAITLSGDPMDDNGHGTHCSGTIGAVGNNGQGVAGVNWNVRLMGTKFLNSSGTGSNANAITCIDYIIEEKITYGQDIVVINASWGGSGFDQILKDAIDATGEVGIVFCAAAGNNGTNNDTTPHYPSSYTSSNIIAVTAVNSSGNRYYNYGLTSVDLAAPGVSILSTVRCSYTPQPGDLFYDNMEEGGSLWTHGGTLDSWGITNAASGGLENYWTDKSYGNFWSDSPGTGYVHNVDSWLATANDINLSPYIGQQVYLCFDGGFQFDYFISNDTAAVEVSTDGGSNWNTLVNLGSLYYGYGYYYLKQTYVIPDLYKTANFRFRFHITTDDTDYSYYGYKNRGWIIDNIGISTNVTCGYEYKNGTSMATPHVTGAVAFIAGYYPEETAAERITRILSHVVPLSSLSGQCVTGGLLNLYLALDVITPSITIISPNGGESWETGSHCDITWSSTSSIDYIKIEYSIDSGTSWTFISSYYPNSGNYLWVVPDCPSSHCLIRISDADGDSYDVSDAEFSIFKPTTLTIISPNGGESWCTGTSHDITWTSYGPVGNVKIEYSTDNGTSWSVIAADTENDGSYNWSVPSALSAQCLVRVTDTDGYPSDVSDAVFSIYYPFLTLTAPNGDENWGVGTIHEISWTSMGISESVKLEYTVNNSKSWIEIVSSTANDGGFSWIIPDNPSESCRVRVSDNKGTLSDTSDAVFSIVVLPTITVTSPNGGENLEAGSSHQITWTSTGVVGNVKIEYSIVRPTWTTIISSTPNDGKYTWSVPQIASNTCLVRVSEIGGSPSDTSDRVFKISFPYSITVTSPNGGEWWNVDTTQNITWQSRGTSGNVKIDYSTDNANSWNIIAESTPDTGIYRWVIPNTPSASCLVRVSDAVGSPPGLSDVSNSVFTIFLVPCILVKSPNGGEKWKVGTIHNITWGSRVTSGDVTIDYSTNNGSSWIRIGTNLPDNGIYPWTIPNTPSSSCLVRVSDSYNPLSDTSNAEFTIYTLNTISITSPNGGEKWPVDSTQTVTWITDGDIANVKIESSSDNGSSWRTIVASTPNTGSFSWIIPDTPSDRCLLRISDVAGTVSDVGDAVFSILYPPALTVVFPNGGEVLPVGTSQPITWTGTGAVGDLKIQYSTDSGTTWSDITTSTANDGSFTWTVPNTPSSACLVRISEIDDIPADVSNTVFTITDQTQRTITVTSPNGGENLEAGTTHEITWTTSGTFDSLLIQYSSDGGTSWRVIVESTENDGSFQWTVPVVHSPNCLVRIAEKNKDNPSDTSDEVFSIIGPTITVVSPNGGESFATGSMQSITWTTTGSVEKVSIAYSVDGGKSWTIIAEEVENVENNGSFSWTVPNRPSANCLVQIKETDDDEGPKDTSDGKFSILPPTGPTITVLYPNGGETLFAGSQVEITWTGTQSIANVEIAYSPDNGLTWTGIITSTPNDGKYQWKAPGISSDQVLIRVRDTDGEPSDTSDGVFSILLPTSLAITSPNGGETLYAGTSHEITWNWTGSIAKVNLGYSPDGGKTWNSIAVSVDNDGSYDWAVPGTPSQHCLVRVSEGESDKHAWDVSNSEFSIDASSYSSITVISPNGGETLYAGSSFEITWASMGISGDVKIDYSYDQGFTWEEVVESTANNGSYSWTVPGTPSSVCLVRVSGTGGNSTPVSDGSDAVFEISTGIKPNLTVIVPNGGETLYLGSVYEITWAAAGSIDKIAIEYSTDGGLTWEKIAEATAVDGRYQWTVPETPASVTDSGLVRISAMEGDLGPWDVSDAVFSIVKPEGPTLTVTSPNGGERLMVDTNHEITWTNTGEIEAVMIEYSIDRGSTWVTVTGSTANQGSYEWTVPGTLSEHCLVRVRGIDSDKSPSDTSDNVFSIVPWVPGITVTYPNGGETFYADSLKVITWSCSPTITNVMIEYSIDNGAAWSTITGSTPNTGSYEWTVPQNSSVQCLVRVSAVGSGGVSDISDAVFSIVIETYNCGFQGIACEEYPNGGYGPPIPGVEITFVSEDGSLTKRTTTNSTGYYKISLKPQRYMVSTKHPDYQDYTTAPGFFVVTGDGYQTGNFFLTRK